MACRRETKALEAYDLSQRILMALREAKEKNPVLEKALKHVGLL
ncbi:MAG: hypothetical protein NZM25_06455 [Leptospiraceae bacterium]|nr:hypothetical protein [Leptospiraceae bacterium]MDW8306583.1 hypothetical protein [Leptospiraceae bacterium]